MMFPLYDGRMSYRPCSDKLELDRSIAAIRTLCPSLTWQATPRPPNGKSTFELYNPLRAGASERKVYLSTFGIFCKALGESSSYEAPKYDYCRLRDALNRCILRRLRACSGRSGATNRPNFWKWVPNRPRHSTSFRDMLEVLETVALVGIQDHDTASSFDPRSSSYCHGWAHRSF